MKKFQKVIVRYVVTAAIAGGMTLFVMWLRDFWNATGLADIYWILADAFTVPGVILVMLAGLVWASTDGFFDGIGYVFNRIGNVFIPFHKKSIKHLTYREYKQSKEGNRLQGYSFLLFVGLAFVVVAVVFTVLHGTVYVP